MIKCIFYFIIFYIDKTNKCQSHVSALPISTINKNKNKKKLFRNQRLAIDTATLSYFSKQKINQITNNKRVLYSVYEITKQIENLLIIKTLLIIIILE